MAHEVKLPRLGQGMESGTVIAWRKQEGDQVEKGEPLFEVETEKATQEVEAEQSGVLLRIAVATGEVLVGQTIAFIGEPGEELAAPAAPASARNGAASEAPSAARPPARAELATDFRAAIHGARSPARLKASPLARRRAREQGVDLRQLAGSGPDGRIVVEDVERAALGRGVEPAPPPSEPVAPAVEVAPVAPASQPEAPLPAGEVEAIPLSRIRRTIARRLSEAWQLPVFQLTVSVEMTHANALVERSRELNPEVRVTVTDLLAKVCARALMRHRELNAQFTEEALLRFPSAHVGIAVAAPQGLVVPVIAGVERLSLTEVAARRAELVARARDGRLSPLDLEGGTFTISNLGMFGVEQFTAVLNPPQAAILAVGATVDQPVARNGAVVIAPMLTMTLTVDHRAVDGGPAAAFLQTVKTFLEDPALAL